MDTPLILVCQCAHYRVLPRAATQAVVEGLRAAGASVRVVDDLCELAARKDPALQEFAQASALRVVACHPRAVKTIFHAGGAPLNGAPVEWLNLRATPLADVMARLGLSGPVPAVEVSSPVPPPADQGTWPAWFPAIDYDRCRNCQQCVGFCLFGVYALSPKGRVVVENPQSCKTNCPACARICPDVAIVFPKAGEAPINGAEIDDEADARAQVKVNLEKMFGSNSYEALAARKKQNEKRRLLRTQTAQALAERDMFLKKEPPTPPSSTPFDPFRKP